MVPIASTPNIYSHEMYSFFFYGMPKTKSLSIECQTPECEQSSLERTAMCSHVLRNEACPYNKKCKFGHNLNELRLRFVGKTFKKKPCINNKLHSNMFCSFRHPEDIVERDEASQTLTVAMHCPLGNGAPFVYMIGCYAAVIPDELY